MHIDYSPSKTLSPARTNVLPSANTPETPVRIERSPGLEHIFSNARIDTVKFPLHMFLVHGAVNEAFANTYVRNNAHPDRGKYLGKQKIHLDSDGNVVPMHSGNSWRTQLSPTSTSGTELKTPDKESIVDAIKEALEEKPEKSTQVRFSDGPTVPLYDKHDYVMIDNTRWICTNVRPTSEPLTKQMSGGEGQTAYGTISRRGVDTEGHIVFFTVKDKKVKIYDPNGRSAVFVPEIRTNVSMTFDLKDGDIGKDTRNTLLKISQNIDSVSRELEALETKIANLRKQPLETKKAESPQPSPGPVAPKGKRGLYNRFAFTLSDDLETIQLTPEEARSLASEHKAAKERTEKLEKLRGNAQKTQRQLAHLEGDRIIELDKLKQEICDSIRDEVSKNMKTPDMMYVSYGIMDGERAMSVAYTEKETFAVTFTVRCIPSEKAIPLYEGYSDSWVDAHIHTIDTILGRSITCVRDVKTETRVRQRDAKHSKTIAATKYFCDELETVYVTVPNMNFSVGTKHDRKISTFMKRWMGVEENIDGICAMLALLFLKNYVDRGSVQVSTILNDTRTMFFQKEDGEILILLYLLGRMYAPMINMKDALLPTLNKLKATSEDAEYNKWLQKLEDPTFRPNETFSIVKGGQTKTTESEHAYTILGAGVEETIYALGKLDNEGDVKRIRNSLGFIEKTDRQPIRMSLF